MSRLVLILVVLGVAAPARAQFEPDPAPAGPARHAFVWGLDGYDDPAWAPLRFAEADAVAVAEVLGDPEVGGFASVEVRAGAALGPEALLKDLRAWARRLRPDDLAVLYFSGHAAQREMERGPPELYLATRGTRRDSLATTALPVARIEAFLQGLTASRRVLIVDACFTGSGKTEEPIAADYASDEPWPLAARAADGEARLFATSWGRPALESKSLGHGVYTHHLLAALTDAFDEADLDDDLTVSVSEAHDYARDRTLEMTEGVQIPMVQYRFVGRETLLLAGDPNDRRRARLALLTSYDSPQEGMHLRIDGAPRGSFPRSLPVEPGVRSLEFLNAAGKVVDRGRFPFREGEVYDVGAVRDALVGGRVLLGVGGGVQVAPVAGGGHGAPVGPGLLVTVNARLGMRNPVARRITVGVDGGWTLLPENDETGMPRTHLFEVGVGPAVRLDVGRFQAFVRPRAALVFLVREAPVEPFPGWVLGGLGGEVGVGVRPAWKVGVQLRYAATAGNLDIAAEGAPRIRVSHRVSLVTEFGF